MFDISEDVAFVQMACRHQWREMRDRREADDTKALTWMK
jgi:hypothetical protein